MNSVFILGAGASAHTGVPLMNNFLEVVEDIYRTGLQPDDPAYADFGLVVRGRAVLQSVLAKAQFDIRNLESVFAAFELSTVFGELGLMTKEDVDKLVPAMKRVIVATIEKRMDFGIVHHSVQPTSDYHQFAVLLRLLKSRGECVSVITFNYDIGLEFGLWAEGLEFDYWLDATGAADDTVIGVLKLHGSINWVVCKKCGAIVAEHIRDIVKDKDASIRATGADIPPAHLAVATRLSKLTHCDEGCDGEPAIVPPTVEKGGLRQQFEPVWKRAAMQLREADNIFVIGYSWPQGDQFFHQLYALGTVGPRVLRKFWICDLDPRVAEHFEAKLLGPLARDRVSKQGTFKASLNPIAHAFGVDGLPTPSRR